MFRVQMIALIAKLFLVVGNGLLTAISENFNGEMKFEILVHVDGGFDVEYEPRRIMQDDEVFFMMRTS